MCHWLFLYLVRAHLLTTSSKALLCSSLWRFLTTYLYHQLLNFLVLIPGVPLSWPEHAEPGVSRVQKYRLVEMAIDLVEGNLSARQVHEGKYGQHGLCDEDTP